LYIGEGEARHRFASLRKALIAGQKSLPLFNTFSDVFFSRHKNLLSLCFRLQEIGANAMLTGSGSGFFCLVHKSMAIDTAERIVRRDLGANAFIATPMLVLDRSRGEGD
jgi:4-diphosphocytidyl-2C-methyl-D-erythritol kinase